MKVKCKFANHLSLSGTISLPNSPHPAHFLSTPHEHPHGETIPSHRDAGYGRDDPQHALLASANRRLQIPRCIAEFGQSEAAVEPLSDPVIAEGRMSGDISLPGGFIPEEDFLLEKDCF
ncbi:hypothetical protein R3P38DRAFT_3215214 [Favolaschia claudopus]|uniref:Uncharacterized protein n=1 Tax=Favolaschia claudopus TaxID=2862362 RepID=A0AAW0A8P9_9AGAR